MIRTMRSITLMSALLLCSWICVSLPQTVRVQPGEDVTLLCSNISKTPTHTFWSRIYNKTRVSCIASMYGSDGNASLCNEAQKGKYEISTNVSRVFLKIKQVNLSDSGLYLCGFHVETNTILAVTDLNVQGNDESDYDAGCEFTKEPDGITELTSLSLILGVVTLFLIMVIIGLAVKHRKLQTVHDEERNPQNQNPGSDDLNYTVLSFHSKAKRSGRPASQTELEPHVMYTTTRWTQETSGTAAQIRTLS